MVPYQPDKSVRCSGIGNVFVKCIDKTIGNREFNQLFAKYGKVTSSKLVLDERGESKGYGFVQFETEEAAETAINELHDTSVWGQILYVAKFLSKSQRMRSPANQVNI